MQTITLESLLIGEQMDAGPILEPYEAAMECADAFMECAEIEQNLTTYEAAKLIKKSKSASKKVKTTTSKMKAKDAKAKKAGGKVIKIKKVTKESDEFIDGGTGPTPTTSDTNGLTDTDLDVDPDAEVEVTEIADDQPVSQESADWYGMIEGDDYIVEYEDASILALEDGSKNMLERFRKNLAELWKNIVDFVKSVYAKIVETFDFDRKFVEKNKDAIEKGLSNPGNIEVKIAKIATGGLNKTLNEINDILTKVSKNVSKMIAGGQSKEFAQSESDKINEHNKFISEKVEKKLSEMKVSYNEILSFFGEGQKKFKAFVKEMEKTAADAKTQAVKADKEHASEIRRAASVIQKYISHASRQFNLLRSAASTIARAAARAGGAKVDDNKK